MADAMAVRMVNASARTIPTVASFGAMCPLLATRQMSPCRTLEGLNGKMCERLHTSLVVQKMQCGQKRWLLRRRRRRCWRSALALAQTARFGARGRRAAGRRRDASPLRLVCDGQVQRRRVRVPIRRRNIASQVLLGRLHRRDGMRRLMLCFRELLDVVLQRVELAP